MQDPFLLECLTLEDVLIGCAKMLVQNYHSMLHKIPEGRRSHIQDGDSLKSRIMWVDKKKVMTNSVKNSTCQGGEKKHNMTLSHVHVTTVGMEWQ